MTAPKNAAAAVEWPLGKLNERFSGRGRMNTCLSDHSMSGAVSMSATQSHQRSRARGKTTKSSSVPGTSPRQSPPMLKTRKTETTVGPAMFSSDSRMKVSMGEAPQSTTAVASATKQAEVTIRTPRGWSSRARFTPTSRAW